MGKRLPGCLRRTPYPVRHDRAGRKINGKAKTPSSEELGVDLATLTRLELATSAVTGRRANQLRHRAVLPTGFEPVLPP